MRKIRNPPPRHHAEALAMVAAPAFGAFAYALLTIAAAVAAG
ncbi:hypothetical protein [Phenylobacterium sp.]|jgi:hypothetical protein|nr:hypothetical protein [Phenylobacterium sp.]HEX2559948.1 hypothetical protein [Phenylobacterium sp.]